MYKHGMENQELATQVPEPQKTTSGVPIVVGTAPINVAKNPKINEPAYVENYAQAVEQLGYVEDFKNYTLCQVMYTALKKFGVAPIVFINVLDPRKHKKDLEAKDYNVTDGQATIDTQGIILDTLTIKNGAATLVKDTDYVATFDDNNQVLITLVNATASTINVAASVLDPSKVTASDIIGAYDDATGTKTGLELVEDVHPKLQVVPGCLLAPGFSQNRNVAAMLQSKAENINGIFNCMALVDLDTTAATKYTDVEKAKSDIGVSGAQTVLLWPNVKYGDLVVSYSAVMAALMQFVDSQNGGVPAKSPSNQLLGCDSICLADGTEVLLDEMKANTLNAIGVVTATNYGGWRSWGNNTACYPINTDPKDRWINCKRYFFWRENNFIVNVHSKIDGIPNAKQIDSIVDNENVKGNSYVANGYCAGDRIEFSMQENMLADIVDGKFKFHFFLAPFSPMEYIKTYYEMDVNAIQTYYNNNFTE